MALHCIDLQLDLEAEVYAITLWRGQKQGAKVRYQTLISSVRKFMGNAIATISLFPEQELTYPLINIIIIIMYVSAYALAVLIAVITPVRRVITNEQGLIGGPSSIFIFLTRS